ncbi:MAG: HD domain-containing protein [bacterium]
MSFNNKPLQGENLETIPPSLLDQQGIINFTKEYIKNQFSQEGSGHDWQHIYRVWNTSKQISAVEGGNTFIIEMAALLHDIADWKFYGGDLNIGPQKAKEWLTQFNINKKLINSIVDIVANISFKGIAKKNTNLSPEGQIVQDADRLDTIGAIGIARVFAYSGFTGRQIYNPNLKPIEHKSTESYFNNNNTAINHFYEKLLLLKDLMNTNYAKKLAEERHNFMVLYLNQFFKEVGE